MRHFRYFAVSRREQNEVDDFSKSTSRLKSTNRDSSNYHVYRAEITRFKAISVKISDIPFCWMHTSEAREQREAVMRM